MLAKKLRIVVAKVGCDIHERGALTLLNVFRDAGMEAIYNGRYHSEESIAKSAVDENADVIAVTDLSGSLVIICRKIKQALKELKAEDIIVTCGGILTKEDIDELRALGVEGCFPTGTPTDEILEKIKVLAG
ncbi:MAG: cobalamin-dependent protein [Acidaminococcales bacterium]|jgi:methylmalonyl-CoA mutase C-terminal domain/subunit|nr:cobalamin-dependent protein [Acidaminococcales bacterium]